MAAAPPSPNLHVAIHPKPGKESRVLEVAKKHAEQVKAHEPWISMYRVVAGKNLDGKLEAYYIVARLDDMSKVHTRREMEHHKVTMKAIEDEDLLNEPLKFSVLEEMTVWKR
ncbi:hypothetical protein PV11_07872 [Exophiala sideris]|uniref:ABM domain-containing protein n=1 Tax=Exophiala sideris TaxID=1016849 RepID=A0A0D1WYY4_9EURO|nr:hypothetical protein PV11_07872 [Exophiala sideris]